MALIAQASEWGTILELLDKGGTVALLVVIVLGSVRGWWVPGRLHERVTAERDRLLELAIRSTNAAKGATDLVAAQRQTAEQIAQRAAVEAIERARDEGMI